jgi:hypothetical protein
MEPKNFKVGQVWKTKNGVCFRITHIANELLEYPMRAESTNEPHNAFTFTYDGFLRGPSRPTLLDLVELVTDVPAEPLEDDSNCLAVDFKPDAPDATDVHLRLECLRLAMQHNDGIGTDADTIRTAEIFLAFVCPPPKGDAA